MFQGYSNWPIGQFEINNEGFGLSVFASLRRDRTAAAGSLIKIRCATSKTARYYGNAEVARFEAAGWPDWMKK